MDVEKKIKEDQGYEARGVVARINKIGDVQIGLIHTPVYKYITLDRGAGQRGIVVQFVSPAPRVIDELSGDEFLDMASLKEGDIVVSPGLVYEKIEWTDALYAEHLAALRTYRPKDILISDAPSKGEEAVDLGKIDLTTDAETKHLIKKDQQSIH